MTEINISFSKNCDISVIIPLYNKGFSIRRALDSIFTQTFYDFEVIVVDDGSTDDGPEIVLSYKDPRLRYIQQSNAGPGAARNRGVKEAVGQFVAFLDADDEWLPCFLEYSLDNLKKSSVSALSTCDYYIEPSKKTTQLAKYAALEHGVFFLQEQIDPVRLGFIVGIIHSAGTVLCRKKIIDEYGGFFENKCKWGEDRYLWLQVLLNNPIYYDTRKMFFYHVEDSSLAISTHKRDFWPALTHPEKIRKNCPSKFRNLLDKHLAYFALKECHAYFEKDNIDEIKKILQKHPMSSYMMPIRYFSLRIKMIFPGIVDLWRKKYDSQKK